jgi:hypothetical protein
MVKQRFDTRRRRAPSKFPQRLLCRFKLVLAVGLSLSPWREAVPVFCIRKQLSAVKRKTRFVVLPKAVAQFSAVRRKISPFTFVRYISTIRTVFWIFVLSVVMFSFGAWAQSRAAPNR